MGMESYVLASVNHRSFANMETIILQILKYYLFFVTFISTVTYGDEQLTKDSKVISEKQPPHSEVLKMLLTDYEPHIVPLEGVNKTLEIAVGVAMINMEELTRTGVLTTTTWMRMVWNDHRLQWNQTEFGNVSVIRLDPRKIWVPDIEVYNAADTSQYSLSSQMSTGATNALIYPDGEVLFIPPVNLKVLCMNFTHSNWPQGEQECNIKLGSWTHDGHVLNLTLFNNKENIDLTDMSPASPWLITKQLGKTRREKFYDCCPEPYQDLNFRFKLKPQYPITDPSTIPSLLYQLLVVTILAPLVLVCGGGWALWSQNRGKLVRDDYKMRILQEQLSRTST